MKTHARWAVLAIVGVWGCGGGVDNSGAGGAAATSGSKSSGSQGGTAGAGGTSTGGGASASSSKSSSTSAGASTSTSGAGGGCGTCQPAQNACCDGSCVDTTNDPFHCGDCMTSCPGQHPFCDISHCSTAKCNPGMTCSGADQFCCGGQCCTGQQLCCVLAFGESTAIGCADPVQGTCPPHQMTICASPDTPIATPDGERSMVSLRAGDLVYSLDAGAIRAVPLLRVQRAPAVNHHVVHVELDSGETLEISPSHPTADGRTFGDLHVGDRLDGHFILEARLIPYALDFTVDILPDSDTGTYYAGGARIGTTMRR